MTDLTALSPVINVIAQLAQPHSVSDFLSAGLVTLFSVITFTTLAQSTATQQPTVTAAFRTEPQPLARFMTINQACPAAHAHSIPMVLSHFPLRY